MEDKQPQIVVEVFGLDFAQTLLMQQEQGYEAQHFFPDPQSGKMLGLFRLKN